MIEAFISGGDRRAKLTLSIGFFALAGAVLAAYRSPANGYELSIYQATPAAFWIGLTIVALVMLGVAVYGDRLLSLALLLGGGGAAAFAGLPLIRSYYFYGRMDSLIHLGWTRAIDAGGLLPSDLIYPGGHMVSLVLAKAAGVQITRAMQLVVFLFVLAFLLFIPLCVWMLVPDRRALALGAFSGFMFLPINNVSTHFHFHTYSLTTLFVPFVLYLLFKHLLGTRIPLAADRRRSDGGTWPASRRRREQAIGFGFLPFDTSATSYLLPIATTALVLFHPQVALNVLIIFGTIAVVQVGYRRLRPDARISGYRIVYVQAAFLLLFFVAWNSTHGTMLMRTFDQLTNSVVGFLVGSADAAQNVQSQGGSADSIGVSIWELFVKLFAVEFAYVVLASGLVLAKVTGRLGSLDDAVDRRPSGDPDAGSGVISLLFYSGLALIPFFGLHFVGQVSTYFFRHLGFSMVLVTILGAVALYYLLFCVGSADGRQKIVSGRRRPASSRLLGRISGGLRALGRSGRPLVVVVAVLVLALSLATVYPSPTIYLPGQHTPEAEMSGYEATFASQATGTPVWFTGVREGPSRYEAALYGAESAPWERQVRPEPRSSGHVPEAAMLDGLSAHYRDHPEPDVRRDQYLAVSTADREREVTAYRELRYSAESFEAIDAQPGVGRIRDNGEFTLYYVDVPDERTGGDDR